MINQVVIVGRLTKPVDLRYTNSGNAVASFTVAVDRPFKNQSGEKETDFINGQVWKKQAENMANFTDKGSLVGVAGRIQVRSYEKDGKRVYITEVVAESVRFLDSKKQSDNQTSNQSAPQRVDKDPFANDGNPIDIADDDLPF
jgi:single-strand DNA-binding protein